MDRPRDAIHLPDGRLLVRHPGGVSVLPAGAATEAFEGAGRGSVAPTSPAARSGAAARGESASARPEAARVGVLARRTGGDAVADTLASALAPERVAVARAGPDGLPATALAGAALVVVVLEEVPYRTLYGVQEAALAAGVPALFVTADPDALRVGPLAVPGAGPCFACAVAGDLAFLGLAPDDLVLRAGDLRAGALPPSAAGLLAPILAREARAALAGGDADDARNRPELLASRLLVPRDRRRGGRLRVPVERLAACPLCGGPSPRIAGSAPLAAAAERERAERSLARPRYRRHHDHPSAGVVAGGEEAPPSLRVGIVGGGSAGYLAALALRRRFPRMPVTLVESPEVPVIGVGEATTPLMPQFLHVDLGLDAADFFRRVRPTWKLGIRFVWGERPFSYPFGPLRLLEAALYDGDLDTASVRAAEIAAGRLPVARRPGGGWRAAFDTDMAYHLENRRFVRYLAEEAAARGVERVSATVVGVETREGDDGEPEIAALVAADDRRLVFDLYVDCTGFRSLLMGEALGSPFEDYSASLFADRALVAAVPHGDGVAPATTAETFGAGWCWSTPVPEADHRGYVYASAFLSDDEALREMAAACPEMGEARRLRFRAGRRRHAWRGNALALGNAYGFVEPLESTALHLLVRQIGLALGALERGSVPGPALRRRLNERIGGHWDYLRAFLALHYRFNRRRDTPFWRACRDEADLGPIGEELLALYRERGPLSYDRSIGSAFDFPDPLWGPEGVDAVLLGQGVLPERPPRPPTDADGWRVERELYRRVARRGTPQAELLAALDGEPAARERIAAAWAAAFRAAGPAFGSG